MIYFLKRADGAIKIGYSKHPVARIMEQMTNSGWHKGRRLIGTMPGDLADEARLHKQFAAVAISKGGPCDHDREWHTPSAELLAYIVDNRDPDCKVAYEVYFRMWMRGVRLIGVPFPRTIQIDFAG